MRFGLALSCALASGCGFSAPRASEDPPDAPPLVDGACVSFADQLDTCRLPNENAIALMLSGDLTFDTDTGVLKDAMDVVIPVVSAVAPTRGGDVRALVATAVTLSPNTHLRAVGVHGLAIVARNAVTLQAGAVIDVSKGGAGFRISCGAETPAAGTPDRAGAGGGGGGGFGAAGGDGGDGNDDTPLVPGGAGGKVAPAIPAGPLGGCSGARGGKGDPAGDDGGAGGKAGGTVYVMSLFSIGISAGAGIDAGGEGGGGGGFTTGGTAPGNAGGGGGGAGGSIFLEAPVIRSGGTLAANGGGGGEGSDDAKAGSPGMPGGFGIARADGGKGGAGEGADGGDGGFVDTPAGQKPAQIKHGGGGGGGGGAGFIFVKSADAMLGTKVSPAAQ